jgi:hypothetical protein
MGGDDVTVIGRHRATHRYVTMTIRTAWLVNWRVDLVYSPAIIRAYLEHPWAYYAEYPPPDADPLQWGGSPAGMVAAEQLIENNEISPSNIFRYLPDIQLSVSR